jgi:dephospho-CoA kinase
MVGKDTSPRLCNEPIFVGLAGHIGSGKTTAGMYLAQKYGFQYVRYSQVLKEWISDGSAHGDRLQGFGWDVMSGKLQAELNARLISRIDASKSAAIDGLRHPIDFECLTSTFGPSFEMIFLEARQENRFERKQMRFSTLEAFNLADTHRVEAHIDDLRSRARVTVQNDDSLERLYQELDACLTVRRSGDRL